MLTYFILLSFINGVVLTTQSARIAEDINTGDLSRFLLSPISYTKYYMARDFADKMINTFFSLVEITLLILLLKPPLLIQKEIIWWSIFPFSLIFAVIIYFEISVLLSYIAFWSKETWAPRFIFYIVLAFLAGQYFPLDITPKIIYKILMFSPFSYLVYFPIKVYLGNLKIELVIQGFLVMIFWIIVLHLINRFVWKKGLKIYTSEGG